jgi:hypothetical protein
VDAGIVWDRSIPARDGGRDIQTVSLSDVRVTPGVGLRVNSPVGPFRVDVAYNPYSLSSGAVYFVGPDNALRCVISREESDLGGSSAATGRCPPSFEPSHGGSFFNKLTFNFSIGQAF